MSLLDLYKVQLDEIFEIAKRNDNRISYLVVADILKDKPCSLDEFEKLLNHIKNLGITFDDQIDDIDDYSENVNSLENRSDPYAPADVNIQQRPLTITSIISRLTHNEIDLKPEFQRKANLWSQTQQSRLIESLMLKIPIPTFYFNASNDNYWVVIDGLQRLSTLDNFFVKKKLKLTGLEFLNELEGCTVDDLPRHYTRRMNETQIVAYTIEKGTPDEVTYNIFKRINTGGLKLEPQEIRHALYSGKSTTLIKKLAKTDEFNKATGGTLSEERMVDCEFITRFIAYTEFDYKKCYKNNVDDYLIFSMKKVNSYSEDQLLKVEQNFKEIMVITTDIFGKYNFRKIGYDMRRGPINKAIFEAIVYIFNKLNDNERKILKKNKNSVIKLFKETYDDVSFNSYLRSGDKYSIDKRIEKLENNLRSILKGTGAGL